MKRYHTYKDSGVEWIGKVPEGWGVKKLKWLAKVRPSNIDKKSKEGELAVELCNYVDVYYNDNITSNIEFMKATARQDQLDIFSLKEGDILITKDSETPDDIAVPAFVSSSLHGVVCGYHLAHVRPYRKYADGNYLFRSFSARGISDQFEISANGVTRFGIGKQAIDNSVFLTPPLEEQTAIAAYLDRKTTQIDNLILKKQKLIELLKEEHAAIINQTVTKGLNPDAPMKDSGIEWLGEIPAHWEIKKLKYIIRVRSGDGITNEEMNQDAKYEVYGGNGFIGYSDKFNVKSDSIIIGRVGAKCGNVRYLKGEKWISDNALILKSDQDYTYLKYLLESLNLNHLANQNAQPLITSSMVKLVVVTLPNSLEEQMLIANFINAKTNAIDQTTFKIQKQIELLKEFRTALISEVVTGKIDVRDEELK